MIHRTTLPPAPRAREKAARRQAVATLSLVIAAALSTSALTATVAAPVAAATRPTLTVAAAPVLTLPDDDGYRDGATVDIRSNSKLSVRATIVKKKTGVIVDTIASSIALKKKGSVYRGSVRVTADGLTAGTYLLRIADSTNAKLRDDSTLRIGSGTVTEVALATKEPVLFPLEDGYRDVLHADVVAKDETGMFVPHTGTLTVTSGSRHRTVAVSSANDLVSRTRVDISGLPRGSATVRAKVAGPVGSAKQSPTRKLALAGTRVKALSLSTSARVVYPTTDGFRDSVSIALTSSVSVPHKIPVTGTLTISRNGTRAATWKITSSAGRTVTWNGRVGKKIVPGTYTVSATVKGAEGPVVKRSTTLTVSRKSLHRDQVSSWQSARSVLRTSTAYDAALRGDCAAVGGALHCTGYDATRDSTLSLFAWGSVSVPDKVRASSVFHTPSVRVTADVSAIRGSATWAYGHKSRSGTVTRGEHALPWLALNGNPASMRISISLRKNSETTIDRFRIQYNYTVLR